MDNSWLKELAGMLDDINGASNVTWNEKVMFASILIKRNGYEIMSRSVVPLCNFKASVAVLIVSANSAIVANQRPLV